MGKLAELLGDRYADFEKISYLLGSQPWEKSLLV